MFDLYRKEREGVDCIRTDKGCIFYKIEFPVCIIHDYFVLPEYRRGGHGFFLADQVFQICKEADVESVYCQTDDRAHGVDVSRLTILKFGFQEYKKEGPVTTYKMGVKEWARY